MNPTTKSLTTKGKLHHQRRLAIRFVAFGFLLYIMKTKVDNIKKIIFIVSVFVIVMFSVKPSFLFLDILSQSFEFV